jgi:hypothetical protein
MKRFPFAKVHRIALPVGMQPKIKVFKSFEALGEMMPSQRTLMLASAALFICCHALAARGQVDNTTPTQADVAAAVVVVNPPPPKTHLQSMAEQKGALIVCGYTDVGTITNQDGSSVTITAAEFTNTSTATKTYGLLVFIHQAGASARDTRSYLDDDELDSLLSSLDAMAKLDRTTTQLNNFDAKIRTRGDLEIANIDAGGVRLVDFHGVEIVSSSGQEVWASTRFPLARLADVEQYLTSAKQLIDKAKDNRQPPQ